MALVFNPFTGALDFATAPAPPVPGPSTNKGTYNHGGGIAVGDAVYLSAADTVSLADANDPLKQPLIGIVSAVAALSCEVQYSGEMAGFVGLISGSTYYLSTSGVSGGTLTPVAPAPPPSPVIVQKLGFAKSPTVLMLMIDQDFVEL